MPTLGCASGTKAVLEKYNLSIQKKFGQNFLIDDSVLTGTVEAAGVTKDDTVLEIGPGIGTMTQYIAESAGKVIAVEIDKMLIPILADTLSAYDNVKVINQDILKVDIEKIVREENSGKPIKVVANLPYYITTPILMRLLESELPIDSITVMVQKEVADRMAEKPGSKDYGALSLAVQYYTEPSMVQVVPPSCFIPQPGVDSAVIHLKCHKNPPVVVTDSKFMFSIIRAAFSQRRKTLSNGVANGNLGLTREQVVAALEKMGLNPSVRGEKLSLSEFAELSNLLIGERNDF
ncbi:16S rRNA (adenine1518-N6/adenine1519-N6)-dimethyltransferase [Butyrivibrio sp. ob235]|uniref:16S rRNA (adenine(1518)-N(6)/adenine(1519)-N(6))- dimethyltransferase RsmA n=1 Tax=Butyrivibrio sp. ob235 TaxID=1761780 RepID=UPI0008D2DA36|nr:16S rRNA (adenine(1518)-N(6)/adenine(1519)-N(6))-dimethyltransferase RsmA [Butyrivibrio sp. ob235]SEL65796.1 16S rRNA (adenine1518-N6/adenine1519-N6)-dimethyltransferase [Butyrivibrio sp. ob235]